jgi:3'-5' exoribonuclease
MLDQVDLVSLRKDDKIDHYLIVRKCEVRTGKTNKQYYYLSLGDRTLSLSANIWDNFESFSKNIKCGDILKVRGVVDEYQNSLQIRITDLRLTNDQDFVSYDDFMAKSVRNLEEMRREFYNRINLISDTWLKTLLLNIFNKENFRKFALAPAGKSWHHSYLHGLLEHTLEIIKICDLIADFHPELNRDLLIAGAMLHDFGKTEELSYDLSFDYTDKGKLLGHIVIAAMIINEEVNKLPDFPEDLKNCLLHMVLSHQGKLEFASPVVPKTLEAITLYQADELSAKVNAYKNAISTDTRTDNKWTKWLNLISTDLYNHGIVFSPEEITEEPEIEKPSHKKQRDTQETLFDKGL